MHPPITCEIHSDRDRDLAENISEGSVKSFERGKCLVSDDSSTSSQPKWIISGLQRHGWF